MELLQFLELASHLGSTYLAKPILILPPTNFLRHICRVRNTLTTVLQAVELAMNSAFHRHEKFGVQAQSS